MCVRYLLAVYTVALLVRSSSTGSATQVDYMLYAHSRLHRYIDVHIPVGIPVQEQVALRVEVAR